MLTLGLHFGHDANMALVDVSAETTVLIDFAEKERGTRIKHALGLSGAEIAAFLARNGLRDIGGVEAVHVTSTQQMPIVDFDGRLGMAAVGHASIPLRVDPGGRFFRSLAGLGHHYDKHLRWFSGPIAGAEYFFDEGAMAFPAAHFEAADPWAGLAALRRVDDGALHRQELALTLDGVPARRAWFVSHHLAHASYAARSSPFRNALVVTFDGQSSVNYDGGGLYLYLANGDGQALLPVAPHGFWCGAFYDHVGIRLGFEGDGAAGKLMGLSSYGVPVYDDPHLVGPRREARSGRILSGWTLADAWLRHIAGGRDLRWDVRSPPPELQANIASSAQRIFERNVLALVSRGLEFARAMDVPCDGVVLAGGCALNCPANSLVAQIAPTYVPPAVNDEGLSLGAATIDAMRPFGDAGTPRTAYLGREPEVADAWLAARAAALDLGIVEDGDCRRTARLLADGRIGAFFHGRSEVGPRALGHRSLLASPLIADNHRKVNALKNREPWRPLAPMATAAAVAEHFSHVPPASHFMLFTGKCTSTKLPATTHVDGSARVQLVDAGCGPVFELLRRFGEMTGVEVLLNTSFNGRDEPIVESPEDALAAFLAMGLAFLWIEGRLLTPRLPAS